MSSPQYQNPNFLFFIEGLDANLRDQLNKYIRQKYQERLENIDGILKDLLSKVSFEQNNFFKSNNNLIGEILIKPSEQNFISSKNFIYKQDIKKPDLNQMLSNQPHPMHLQGNINNFEKLPNLEILILIYLTTLSCNNNDLINPIDNNSSCDGESNNNRGPLYCSQQFRINQELQALKRAVQQKEEEIIDINKQQKIIIKELEQKINLKRNALPIRISRSSSTQQFNTQELQSNQDSLISLNTQQSNDNPPQENEGDSSPQKISCQKKKVTYHKSVTSSKFKDDEIQSIGNFSTLKKKSSFCNSFELENSFEEIDADERSKLNIFNQNINYDFIGVKNNPLVLKIMKRNPIVQQSSPNDNQNMNSSSNLENNLDQSADQLFYSDKIWKISHSRQKQERMICLDSTYVYIINPTEMTKLDYKKFFIHDINKIIISANSNLHCSIHIKKEFELIIETSRSKQLINYIKNIFVSVLKQQSPLIQQSKISNLETQSMKTSLYYSKNDPISRPANSPNSKLLNKQISNNNSVDILQKLGQDDQQKIQSRKCENRTQSFKILISVNKNNSLLKFSLIKQQHQAILLVQGEKMWVTDCEINEFKRKQPLSVQSQDSNLLNGQQAFQFIDSLNNKYIIQLQEKFDSPLLIAKLNRNLLQAI